MQLLKVENEKEGKGIDDLKLKAFSCNVIVIVSVPFNIEPDLLQSLEFYFNEEVKAKTRKKESKSNWMKLKVMKLAAWFPCYNLCIFSYFRPTKIAFIMFSTSLFYYYTSTCTSFLLFRDSNIYESMKINKLQYKVWDEVSFHYFFFI